MNQTALLLLNPVASHSSPDLHRDCPLLGISGDTALNVAIRNSCLLVTISGPGLRSQPALPTGELVASRRRAGKESLTKKSLTKM